MMRNEDDLFLLILTVEGTKNASRGLTEILRVVSKLKIKIK